MNDSRFVAFVFALNMRIYPHGLGEMIMAVRSHSMAIRVCRPAAGVSGVGLSGISSTYGASAAARRLATARAVPAADRPGRRAWRCLTAGSQLLHPV